MRLPPDYQPDFKSLIVLLREMAEERSVDGLLKMIVDRFSKRPPIALVQIWLKSKGDICSSCSFYDQCSKLEKCLHLVAWDSRYENPRYSSPTTSRNFKIRIPLGVGMVGNVGATGKSIELEKICDHHQLLSLPYWVPRDDIVGLTIQPLINQQQVLGVFALFLRMEPQPEGINWSRIIADHTASAIANARAFEEIETLKKQVELENEYLREEVSEAKSFGDLIGKSSAMLNVTQQVDHVAPTDASVLILGESGTGKELIAREVHKRSQRRDNPLIKINCASISSQLYESEFFGHIKGAFTGAFRDRAGRFEAADGGTLFLDEVGEIPLELQSKLLRVLQDGSYERVGEETTRHVDVRIIAATNKDLRQEVDENRFRIDLYYRLNVFPIEVPPLRHREEDIPLLVEHFLKQICNKMNRPQPRLTETHLSELLNYKWPGNVRELQNLIERSIITQKSGALNFDLHPNTIDQMLINTDYDSHPLGNIYHIITEAEMQKRTFRNIRAALMSTKGKIYGPQGAAAKLGMKPTTLYARIKKLGLK